MRMLVDFQIPIEPFNSLVKKGTAGQLIQKALGEIKPEAVYFTTRNGSRGGTMVVDVADPSKLPSVAEPLFLSFNATVQFLPCMTPEDLGKAGLEELGKRYA